MNRRVTTMLAAAFLFLAPAASHAALAPYAQDFEALVQSNPNALGANGWVVYGNVFSPDIRGKTDQFAYRFRKLK